MTQSNCSITEITQQVTLYQTSDGQTFSSLEDAQRHTRLINQLISEFECYLVRYDGSINHIFDAVEFENKIILFAKTLGSALKFISDTKHIDTFKFDKAANTYVHNYELETLSVSTIDEYNKLIDDYQDVSILSVNELGWLYAPLNHIL